MCGIAGWVGNRNCSENLRNQNTKVINNILDSQNHRGPDARGFWASDSDPVIFGHNRLSIIELSEAGSQPMKSRDGKWVISYNGELYNYKELRERIEKKHGVQFKGNSDTEVFLYGFVYFGPDEFLRLADGMFSAAIYDTSNQELFLMRDKAGEKPLFYHQDSNGLFFSSELKSLASHIPSREMASLPGLQLYLLLRYVPAPHTIIKNIYKLQAGHYLRYTRDRKLIQIPYFSWDPHASEITPTKSNYAEVVKATETFLVKSLEKRLMSDVPLGFFLSGGVDSTLCAALIRKYFGKEINSYTIGFEGDSASEHGVAEKTAAIIGARHSTKILQLSELNSRSAEFIKNLDEPLGDRSCVPTYLLCKHAKSEVTVALGGDGGDELFSGYSRYWGMNKAFSESSFDSPVEILKAYFSNRLPVFGFQSLPALGEVHPETEFYFSSLATHLFPPADTEQAIRFVDFKSYLPGAVLSKVDRMSMLVSLEVRTPFFSPSLLELASRLPHEFLYRGSEMKPVLRDICRKIGLTHVADLPKKGFGMPAEFLKQSQNQLIERARNALTYLNSCERIGMPGFGTKIAKFVGMNMNSLWSIIVLGEWFKNFGGSPNGLD